MTDTRFYEIAALLEITDNWMNGSVSDHDYAEFVAECENRCPTPAWSANDESIMVDASDTGRTY